jgi:hypothetical protein
MFRYLSKKISMSYAFGSEENSVVRGPSKRMEMLIPRASAVARDEPR